ncbi:hypothetical protein XELAEV_18042237mg [Xenopus laevis]|uniref:Uncharacterized protein n=1 Tax=Xenopus laevis TaxID=8355 RepID=A0A974C3R7_XENLA|nr:hypothetical protein XELAEV_18042237mg [Xenopus laevis]
MVTVMTTAKSIIFSFSPVTMPAVDLNWILTIIFPLRHCNNGFMQLLKSPFGYVNPTFTGKRKLMIIFF